MSLARTNRAPDRDRPAAASHPGRWSSRPRTKQYVAHTDRQPTTGSGKSRPVSHEKLGCRAAAAIASRPARSEPESRRASRQAPSMPSVLKPVSSSRNAAMSPGRSLGKSANSRPIPRNSKLPRTWSKAAARLPPARQPARASRQLWPMA